MIAVMMLFMISDRSACRSPGGPRSGQCLLSTAK
jgi:hypothetical protein